MNRQAELSIGLVQVHRAARLLASSGESAAQSSNTGRWVLVVGNGLAKISLLWFEELQWGMLLWVWDVTGKIGGASLEAKAFWRW